MKDGGDVTSRCPHGSHRSNRFRRKVLKELESYGVKFNEVDKQAFKNATARIYKEIPGLTPNVYDNLVAELTKIRATKK